MPIPTCKIILSQKFLIRIYYNHISLQLLSFCRCLNFSCSRVSAKMRRGWDVVGASANRLGYTRPVIGSFVACVKVTRASLIKTTSLNKNHLTTLNPSQLTPCWLLLSSQKIQLIHTEEICNDSIELNWIDVMTCWLIVRLTAEKVPLFLPFSPSRWNWLLPFSFSFSF